jgi:hypothetical protein
MRLQFRNGLFSAQIWVAVGCWILALNKLSWCPKRRQSSFKLNLCWTRLSCSFCITFVCGGDLDGSLMAPPNDSTLSTADCLLAVQSVFSSAECRNRKLTVTIFDAHAQLRLLSYCGIDIQFNCRDPKVACWLLDPSGHEKNFHSMITNYCPDKASLLEGLL